MTEEKYFRKNYPDFCYGDKPLSPYWDLFQDGVEFGERQSENRIENLERKLEQTEKDLADYQFNYPKIKELEKENAELRNNGFTVSAMTEQQLKVAIEKGEQLETRCTELFLQNNEFAERFEKATEIIKGLLSCCRNYPQENAEKMKQAEQFLRENEDDLKNGCPDVLCEDCTKEDCTVRKLGLVPTKEIEK